MYMLYFHCNYCDNLAQRLKILIVTKKPVPPKRLVPRVNCSQKLSLPVYFLLKMLKITGLMGTLANII